MLQAYAGNNSILDLLVKDNKKQVSTNCGDVAVDTVQMSRTLDNLHRNLEDAPIELYNGIFFFLLTDFQKSKVGTWVPPLSFSLCQHANYGIPTGRILQQYIHDLLAKITFKGVYIEQST